MSGKLPDIPPPPPPPGGAASGALPDIPSPPGADAAPEGDGKDIYSEMFEKAHCPLCHIPFEKKVHDQWVRTYDGREVWLTDVHFLECTKCGSTMYPHETLEYFERARNDEIPNLKSRVYVPDVYDDEDES